MAGTLSPLAAKQHDRSHAHAVGRRALANTFYRSLGEIVGRLASLALFIVVARRLGEHGFGAFVFAIAYLGFVMIAVDLGLDRYMLRAVARDTGAADHLFFNVIALKAAIAVPLFAAGLVALHLIGYSANAQLTALALAPGVFADSVARTQASIFEARERGRPPAVADGFQRILSAGLGIAALLAGYGVVAVGISYSIGSISGVALGFVLLHRTLGMPRGAVSRRTWRHLTRTSAPFAVQDTFSVLLARMDMLLLGLLAAEAAVGRYGGAYRLFESTFFLTYALTGAFVPMYTNLGRHTEPPLHIMFQRSIKLAIVLLAPVAVTFTVLAVPVVRLIYGPDFGSADSLRILGPCVVLMSVVTMGISLIVSRQDPKRMVLPTAAMAALNVTLNAILIPLYREIGAAWAMLATEAVYVVWVMARANRVLGGLEWARMLAGALAAAAAMVAATLPLQDHLAFALIAGTAAYLLVLVAVERVVSPFDTAYVRAILRARLHGGLGESPSP